MITNRIEFGDCRDTMRRWIDQGVKVQMCVTSPPYWGLRDYGVSGQLGLEASIGEYLGNMVEVFSLVHQLLADDGTLWVNMGDSYAGSRCGPDEGSTLEGGRGNQNAAKAAKAAMTQSRRRDDHAVPRSDFRVAGLKNKDLIGQPWRLAFALQEFGWYLRQDIIWHKPNPMPESVRDRCTKSHEYIFLLSKSERYFYDFDAMKEPCGANTHPRRASSAVPYGWGSGGDHSSVALQTPACHRKALKGAGPGVKNNAGFDAAMVDMPAFRNRRSVWTIGTEPFKGSHFATFPTALPRTCILAGSRPGDVVLDPFMGSGTTAQVAQELGRSYLGCELNPEYELLQRERVQQPGLVLA